MNTPRMYAAKTEHLHELRAHSALRS